MELYDQLSLFVQQGRLPKVKELVSAALEQGLPAQDILDHALLAGMEAVGVKFKNNQVFIPEVMIAARAMNAGIELLRPQLAAAGEKQKGTVVLGSVKGDLHDIGKNLVKMMMEGRGLKVIDLGADVSAQRFIDAALENNADVIACSALLTTVMNEMKNVVVLARERGVRAKIIVGGAPVTQDFCDLIGADGYSADAASAADLALSLIGI